MESLLLFQTKLSIKYFDNATKTIFFSIRVIMKDWIKVFSVVFIGAVVANFIIVSANDNSSTEEDESKIEWYLNLTITWIAKPPYVARPTNGSTDSGGQGLIRDTLLRYMTYE